MWFMGKEPEPDVIVCWQHNSYQLALDQQSRGNVQTFNRNSRQQACKG